MNFLSKLWSALGYIFGFAIVAAFIFIVVNQKKIDKSLDLKSKSVCIAAGEIIGLKLELSKAERFSIGLNSPKAGNQKTVVLWEEKKVKCTLFRMEVDNFVVDGENLTGLVRREERK